MGGQYPPLDRPQVESILKAAGFSLKRHSGTSHSQWEGCIDEQRRIVTVDHLSRRSEQYGKDLLGNMIRQSGLSKKKFYSYL